MKFRGRLYWKPEVVRIWMNGCFFDLGVHSLAASKTVADEFDLELMILSPRKNFVRAGPRIAGHETVQMSGGVQSCNPGGTYSELTSNARNVLVRWNGEACEAP